MKKFFSIAVHSSIRMTKEVYYFIYKDIEFKYTPADAPLHTDSLISGTDPATPTSQSYSIMTEFLSAFAFAHDAEIIPQPGMETQINASLADYKGHHRAKRAIPIRERMDEFYSMPLIGNEHQSTLARLYREARSSNSLYLSILFYWHCLVFPSKKDGDAVNYIDTLWSGEEQDSRLVSECIARIVESPLFHPERREPFSLGGYIRDGVRNSIAHVVRDRENARSLQLDVLSETRHLSDIESVLQQFARHRLITDFGMGTPAEFDVFRYFNP